MRRVPLPLSLFSFQRGQFANTRRPDRQLALLRLRRRLPFLIAQDVQIVGSAPGRYRADAFEFDRIVSDRDVIAPPRTFPGFLEIEIRSRRQRQNVAPPSMNSAMSGAMLSSASPGAILRSVVILSNSLPPHVAAVNVPDAVEIRPPPRPSARGQPSLTIFAWIDVGHCRRLHVSRRLDTRASMSRRAPIVSFGVTLAPSTTRSDCHPGP